MSEIAAPSAASQAFVDADRLLRDRPVELHDEPPAFVVPASVPSVPDPLAVEVPRPAATLLDGPIGRDAAALAAGSTSCAALVEDALAAIEARDAELGAFALVLADDARAEAAALDRELAESGPRGPLHGIPFSVKDNIDVAGEPTRGGSDAYDRVPDADAWVVARLRSLGAVLIGKTNLHEFALGITTPQARNPVDGDRIPGGSSGGAAVAAAAGMGHVAIGTDTRASIRIPAALCGVTGVKPTLGRIPTGGVLPLAWTVDHVGPLAGSVADAALVTAMLIPGGIDVPPVAGRRVGVPATALGDADDDVREAFTAAMEALGRAGMEVVEIDAPSEEEVELANAAGLVISRCEASTYHHGTGTDRSRYWQETQDQLNGADGVPARVYIGAQRTREELRRAWERRFAEGIDLVAVPTSPTVAPERSELLGHLLRLSRNTMLWSLLGVPAVSVPCPVRPGGLPVGLQLIGPPLGDGLVLAACMAFERAA